jgi:HEAT repeat protein
MKNIRNSLYILIPILVLIIESVFIIGCAQNLPASSFGSSDQVLETSDLETSDAVTIPISSGLLTYENTVYNFRIGYPQEWQAREADPNNMGLVYGMLTPEEDDDNPLNYLIVQVEPLPAGATLAQYTQALIQTMRQSNANLQILSTKATTLGGNPANELVITTQDQYNYLKVLKVYTIEDGKAYIITYNTLEENFDYYLETAREVMASFEFMGKEKTILLEPIQMIKDEPVVVTPGPNVSEIKRVVPEKAPETTDEVQTQIRALKDENSFVRAEACDALSALQDPRAVDPLIQALQDSDSIVRSHAADALGEINDSRAVEPLILALLDEISMVRGNAAEALGRIKDERAVEPLILALKDDDSSVRAKACIALGELKDPRAVEPLIEALRDDDINTTVYARISLGEIGSSAVDPLIKALQDKDYLVRSRAAYALGLVEDDRAVEPLILVLSDEEWVVRENAAEALGMIKDERAVEPLISALSDAEWLVRGNAAEALGKIKDGRAVEPLILAIKDDDYIVRKRAAESLGEIGDPRAVEALKEALKDENSDVQSVAKEALAKIENDG